MSFTPAIIDTNLYEEIRQRLGNVSDDIITDEIIEKLSYLQKAEALIKKRVTNYEAIKTADSDDLLFLKVATIALTSYLLLPLVQKLVKSENIIDYSYTNFDINDWASKKKELLSEYNSSISSITGYEIEPPPIMSASGPTRLAELEEEA
ncbi:MAG TPA: hypothetical protein PLE33_05825 [Candidatus Cloacimonas sp.]|nr:hypothetical protein [Candidatus Cloacimonas sp.]HPS60763.1 hypothetical protein [Candidatus Cloacimonas sp.]